MPAHSRSPGPCFAALLASGTTGYSPDPGVAELLAQIATAEQGLPARRPLLVEPDWEDSLDRDLLVTAYVGEYETSPASTPEDNIVNLQRAAERRIMAQLAGTERIRRTRRSSWPISGKL